jgi:hypothetical protein
MRRTITLLPLAIAACVPASRPPQPVPQSAPRIAAPAPLLVPALGPDWRDWPLTPGVWTYRRDARGSVAMFGHAGTDAALTLRCDLGGRQIYLSLAGTGVAPVTVRTSTTARALLVQPTGGIPAYVAATLAPTDPLLDAAAFSRGRFIVEQAGRPPLVIPAHAEIGRVAEDCRD